MKKALYLTVIAFCISLCANAQDIVNLRMDRQQMGLRGNVASMDEDILLRKDYFREDWPERKWFVKDRLVYEKQFTDHVAGGDLNESYMTSLVFSEKEKQLVRKRARLIKRNKRKNGFKLFEVSDFKFSKPEPSE